MKSMAHQHMQRGFDQATDRNRKAKARTVYSRSKHTEDIDWSALTPISSHIIVNSSGQFYFQVGLSRVGGGDVVPP